MDYTGSSRSSKNPGRSEGHIRHIGFSHIDNAERNRRVILNIVRERGPVSRREISEICSLSIATTKRLTEELLAGGRVVEAGTRRPEDDAPERRAFAGRRGRGPRAAALELNGCFGYTVGLNIEPAAIELSVLSFAGKPLHEEVVRGAGLSRDEILARAAGLVRGAAARLRDAGPLLGLGVGVAGLVDARQGIVHYCPLLPGWEEVRLAELLRRELAAGPQAGEVLVEDNVRCMALAEKRYGGGRDLDSFFYVYIGNGVGSAILMDNRFYRGRSGIAGELGHLTVRENGPLCSCGNHGCLEALVSVDALLASIRGSVERNVPTRLAPAARDGGGPALQDLRRAAGAGDRLAGDLLRDAGESIGLAAAGLINILDPGVLILAGEVIEALGDPLLEEIRRAVRRRGLRAITGRTRLLRSPFTPHTASRGAATLVIEKLLDNEILNLQPSAVN